jgi:hypothetical protein
VCDSTAQPQFLTSLRVSGSSYIPKDSSQNELGKVSSVAK